MKLSPAQNRLLDAVSQGPRTYSSSNFNIIRTARILAKQGLVTCGHNCDGFTVTRTDREPQPGQDWEMNQYENAMEYVKAGHTIAQACAEFGVRASSLAMFIARNSGV